MSMNLLVQFSIVNDGVLINMGGEINFIWFIRCFILFLTAKTAHQFLTFQWKAVIKANVLYAPIKCS